MPRIVKWLLFGVVCGLLPILFSVLRFLTRGQPFGLGDLIGHGELLIVTTAVAATGLGELVTESNNKSIGVIFTGFATLLLTTVSAVWFSDIISSEIINVENIMVGSLCVFSASLICTFICFKQTEVA